MLSLCLLNVFFHPTDCQDRISARICCRSTEDHCSWSLPVEEPCLLDIFFSFCFQGHCLQAWHRELAEKVHQLTVLIRFVSKAETDLAPFLGQGQGTSLVALSAPRLYLAPNDVL